jgi:hypothetical protein
MNRLQFIFIIWLIWGGVCLVGLAVLLFLPKVWSSWIEKENNYWVARGRFSNQFAEKIRKLETGVAIKILLAANVIFSAVIIYLLLHNPQRRPFWAMPPPHPPPARMPAN